MKRRSFMGPAAVLTVAGILILARVGTTRFAEPPPKPTAAAIPTELEVTNAVVAAYVTKYPAPIATELGSCPWLTPQATYVGPVGPDTGSLHFFTHDVNITSRVVVTVGRDDYTIWFGGSGDYPNQGLIRVLDYSIDPCASHRLGTTTPSTMTDYTSPRGPLTATKVEGKILFYNIAGGGSGRFNFVAGQFLP